MSTTILALRNILFRFCRWLAEPVGGSADIEPSIRAWADLPMHHPRLVDDAQFIAANRSSKA